MMTTKFLCGIFLRDENKNGTTKTFCLYNPSLTVKSEKRREEKQKKGRVSERE